MIIDCHTHLYESWLDFKGLCPKKFIETMDAIGIEKALVFTMEGFFECEGANDNLFNLCKNYSKRLYPFCTVNPHKGKEALKELRRAVLKLGMKGVKFHPWLQAFSLTNYYFLKIVEETIRLNIPIIFHCGSPPYACPLQVGNLAYNYPEAKLILGEAGLKDLWREALLCGEKYSNVFLCLGGSPFFACEEIVKKVKIDKILFGSDLGFNKKEAVTLEIEKIKSLSLTREEKNKIFSKNILSLINFD